MGQPGSSFAFEIARKIGLPDSILKNAQEQIGQEHIDFDKHLREIVRDKRYWEQKRNNIRLNDKKLSDVLGRYQEALQGIKQERKDILAQAKKEAENLLAEANKKIENTIKTIKESQAEKEKTKNARQDLQQFKNKQLIKEDEQQAKIDRKLNKLKEKERRKAESPKETSSPATPKKSAQKPDDGIIRKGDRVSLSGQSIPGEVLSTNGKEATVAFGNLSTTVKTNRLKKIGSNAYKKQIKASTNTSVSNIGEKVRNLKLTFKPDIDIRGFRADEAVEKVMSHIDAAIMCEVKEVKILHGKGNGILRQMIRDYLDTVPFVRKFHDEHVQYGGSGITVVHLED
jgi:DNA mismatch repair protein MutS2